MNNLQSALNKTGLISNSKYKAITHIQDRIKIIDSQLNHLYSKPSLSNMIKIEQLESQKEILNNC